MPEDHDWHMYDIIKNIEVKYEEGTFHMRNSNNKDFVVTLSPTEFDDVRSSGQLPEGLE